MLVLFAIANGEDDSDGREAKWMQHKCLNKDCRREELKRKYAQRLKYFAELIKRHQELKVPERPMTPIPSEWEDTVPSSSNIHETLSLSNIFSPSLLHLVPDTSSIYSQLFQQHEVSEHTVQEFDPSIISDLEDEEEDQGASEIRTYDRSKLPGIINSFFKQRPFISGRNGGLEETESPPEITTEAPTTTQSPDVIKKWYMDHMTQMLETSSSTTTKPRMVTTPQTTTTTKRTGFRMCPAQCSCSCPTTTTTTTTPKPSPSSTLVPTPTFRLDASKDSDFKGEKN